MKRLQEPPGAREQTIVIWNSTRELPAPGRVGRNTAQVRGLAGWFATPACACCHPFPLPPTPSPPGADCPSCCAVLLPLLLPLPGLWVQEALVECVRRVVFQETAPMGQASTVRLLIGRTQEQGVLAK